jgi:hypothetical protein
MGYYTTTKPEEHDKIDVAPEMIEGLSRLDFQVVQVFDGLGFGGSCLSSHGAGAK